MSERLRIVIEGDGDDAERAIRAVRREVRGLGDDSKRQRKETDDTTRSVQNLNKNLRQGAAAFVSYRMAMQGVKFSSVIAGAGLAAQSINAVGAAAVGTTAALSPLTGLLATLPAGLLAIGQGAGVASLALKDMDEALGGNKKALERLTPEAREFLTVLKEYEPVVRDIQRAAQGGLFGGVTEGLRSARGNADVVRKIAADTATVLGRNAQRAGGILGSEAFGKDLALVGERNVRVIDRMARSGINLSQALRDVTVAAGPLVNWLSLATLRFTDLIEAEAEAGRKSGDLARFFEDTRQTTERLASILQSTAAGLYQVGRAARPLGDDILDAIDDAAQRWEDWTESIQGQNEMRQWFDDAKPAIWELGRLIDDVTEAWLRMGADDGTADLIRQLRTELLPVLEEILQNTTEAFGPALINALVQVGKLMGELSEAGGPLVAFVDAVSAAANALTFLLDTIPGLKELVGSLALGGGIYAALKLSGSIKATQALIGLMRALKVESAAVAAVGGLNVVGGGKPTKGGKPGVPTKVGGVGAGAAAGSVGGLAGAAAGAAIGAGIMFGPGVVQALRDDFAGPQQKARKQFQEVTKDAKGYEDALRRVNRAIAGLKAQTVVGTGIGAQVIDPMTLKTTRDQVKELQRLREAMKFDDVTAEMVRNFRAAQTGTTRTLSAILGEVTINAQMISSRLGRGSDAAKRAMVKNFNLAAAGIRQAMDAGVISTERGLAEIRKLMVAKLQEFGFSEEQAKNIRDGQRYDGGPNEGSAPIKKAGGGWIGSPGERGRDEVPIVVGRGEAVLNHHQQRVVNTALAETGRGNLGTLFSRVKTPHYLASGGFAGGGVVEAGRRIRDMGYAVGEHPCVPMDAEILTRDGWKRHDEVVVGDETLGHNPDTGMSEWTVVEEVMRFGDAEVYEVANSRWRMRSTANHRWLSESLTHGGREPARRRLRELRDIGSELKLITSVEDGAEGHLEITPDEAEILGWVWADGSTDLSGRQHKVEIYQCKEDMVRHLRGLLRGTPHVERAPRLTGVVPTPTYTFYLRRAYSIDLLRRAGLPNGKRDQGLTAAVLAMSPECRRRFLEGFILADGQGAQEPVVIWQNEGPTLDALVVCAQAAGFRPAVTGRGRNKRLSLCKPVVQRRRATVTRVGVEPVWCVRTELGTWTMRQGEYTAVTGNSFGGVTPDVHTATSYHYKGLALDINADNFPGGEGPALDKLASWLRREYAGKILELLWRVAGHHDHLHVAIGGPGTGGTGGIGGLGGMTEPPKIKRVLTDMKGMLGGIGQGALDTARAAAQEKVNRAFESQGGMGEPVFTGAGYDGELDRVFPRHGLGEPGVRLSPDQVVKIAQSVGLPGRPFEQIAHGESDYHPGIVGDDAAAGYGNTFGYGLWQITSGVGNDAMVNSLGGFDQMLNPYKNAMAAKKLYNAAGFSPWYGTRYLTSRNDSKSREGGAGNIIKYALGGYAGGKPGSERKGLGKTAPVAVGPAKGRKQPTTGTKRFPWKPKGLNFTGKLRNALPQIDQLHNLEAVISAMTGTTDRLGEQFDLTDESATRTLPVAQISDDSLRSLGLTDAQITALRGSEGQEVEVLNQGRFSDGRGITEHVAELTQMIDRKKVLGGHINTKKLVADGLVTAIQAAIAERKARLQEVAERIKAVRDRIQRNTAEIRSTQKSLNAEEAKKKPDRSRLKSLRGKLVTLRDERAHLIGHRTLDGADDPTEQSMLGIALKYRDSTRAGLRSYEDELPRAQETAAAVPNELYEAVTSPIARMAKEIGEWMGTAAPKITIPDSATDRAGTADEIARLKAQLFDEEARKRRLAETQMDVFSGFAPMAAQRLIGSYARGIAYVPEDGLALVHKGETITPRHDGPFQITHRQMTGAGSSPNITVVVDGDVGQFVRRVEAMVDGKVARVSEDIGRRQRLFTVAPGGTR